MKILPSQLQKTFYGQPLVKRPSRAIVSPLRVPSAPGRSYKDETKAGGGGAGGQRRARQEDQCNDQGKVRREHGDRSWVQHRGNKGPQWEESLWKQEFRAAILSRSTAVEPGAGTRRHFQ